MLAYLDPGSGSMVAQAVVAGIAGVAVVGKVGWRKLTSPFRRKRKSDHAEAPIEDATAETTAGE